MSDRAHVIRRIDGGREATKGRGSSRGFPERQKEFRRVNHWPGGGTSTWKGSQGGEETQQIKCGGRPKRVWKRGRGAKHYRPAAEGGKRELKWPSCQRSGVERTVAYAGYDFSHL